MNRRVVARVARVQSATPEPDFLDPQVVHVVSEIKPLEDAEVVRVVHRVAAGLGEHLAGRRGFVDRDVLDDPVAERRAGGRRVVPESAALFQPELHPQVIRGDLCLEICKGDGPQPVEVRIDRRVEIRAVGRGQVANDHDRNLPVVVRCGCGKERRDGLKRRWQGWCLHFHDDAVRSPVDRGCQNGRTRAQGTHLFERPVKLGDCGIGADPSSRPRRIRDGAEVRSGSQRRSDAPRWEHPQRVRRSRQCGYGDAREEAVPDFLGGPFTAADHDFVDHGIEVSREPVGAKLEFARRHGRRCNSWRRRGSELTVHVDLERPWTPRECRVVPLVRDPIVDEDPGAKFGPAGAAEAVQDHAPKVPAILANEDAATSPQSQRVVVGTVVSVPARLDPELDGSRQRVDVPRRAVAELGAGREVGAVSGDAWLIREPGSGCGTSRQPRRLGCSRSEDGEAWWRREPDGACGVWGSLGDDW